MKKVSEEQPQVRFRSFFATCQPVNNQITMDEVSQPKPPLTPEVDDSFTELLIHYMWSR